MKYQVGVSTRFNIFLNMLFITLYYEAVLKHFVHKYYLYLSDPELRYFKPNVMTNTTGASMKKGRPPLIRATGWLSS